MKKLQLLIILVLFAAITVTSVFSQTVSGQPSAAGSDIQPKPTIRIWPGKAPGSEDWNFSETVREGPGGSRSYSNVVEPTLTVYLPDAAKANGAAFIVCPGGGMRMLDFSEPEQTAKHLNAKGIAAFILKYRVTPDNLPSSDASQRGSPSRLETPAAADASQRGGIARSGASGRGMGMGNELSFREILKRNGNASPGPANQGQNKIVQMAIADGQQAIRVLRADAAKYHIDPKRIGIMGFSAGGGVAVGTAVTESPDAYPDFVATIYGPSLVDVNVPRQGAPLFIAVMDGHFNVTNGCSVLYMLWKEAGRPVEIHVYDHVNGPGSGMPITNWTDRLYEWLLARKLVTE
jgi:hypothetical protein